jgi:hypothetical protein
MIEPSIDARLALRSLQRDPCTCARGLHCPACLAWEEGEVLVGGQRICSVALWRLTYNALPLLEELRALEELPDTQWRTEGKGWG